MTIRNSLPGDPPNAEGEGAARPMSRRDPPLGAVIVSTKTLGGFGETHAGDDRRRDTAGEECDEQAHRDRLSPSAGVQSCLEVDRRRLRKILPLIRWKRPLRRTPHVRILGSSEVSPLCGIRRLKRAHRCPAHECGRRGRRRGEGQRNSPALRRFDPFQRGEARKSRAMATMANVEILSVSLRTSREFNNRTAAERKVRRGDEGPPPSSTVTARRSSADGRRKVIILSSPYEDTGDLSRSAACPLRRWFAARIVAKFRKETGA